MSAPNVIAISYAKRALIRESRERRRMQAYAAVLGEYHVIVFTNKKEGYPEQQTEGNLTLYATNSKNSFQKLLDARRITAEILQRKSKFQWLVTCQDPFESSVAILGLTRKDTVSLQIQVHGDIFNKKHFLNPAVRLFKTTYAQWVLQQADSIRVVSKRIKDSLVERGITSEKIISLPIQADLQRFLAVGRERQYEEKPSVTFLYVGRLSAEKNLPLLLRAFSRVARENKNTRLQILGDGEERASLENLVHQLGISSSVTFLGWSDTVPQVMADADVFCLASNHEGYAMVLLEAMAAGLPVVTTDVGCAGEVVRSQTHGLIVPVGNEEQYVAALLTLCTDAELRQAYGRAGYRQAQTLIKSDEAYIADVKKSLTV